MLRRFSPALKYDFGSRPTCLIFQQRQVARQLRLCLVDGMNVEPTTASTAGSIPINNNQEPALSLRQKNQSSDGMEDGVVSVRSKSVVEVQRKDIARGDGRRIQVLPESTLRSFDFSCSKTLKWIQCASTSLKRSEGMGRRLSCKKKAALRMDIRKQNQLLLKAAAEELWDDKSDGYINSMLEDTRYEQTKSRSVTTRVVCAALLLTDGPDMADDERDQGAKLACSLLFTAAVDIVRWGSDASRQRSKRMTKQKGAQPPSVKLSKWLSYLSDLRTACYGKHAPVDEASGFLNACRIMVTNYDGLPDLTVGCSLKSDLLNAAKNEVDRVPVSCDEVFVEQNHNNNNNNNNKSVTVERRHELLRLLAREEVVSLIAKLKNLELNRCHERVIVAVAVAAGMYLQIDQYLQHGRISGFKEALGSQLRNLTTAVGASRGKWWYSNKLVGVVYICVLSHLWGGPNYLRRLDLDWIQEPTSRQLLIGSNHSPWNVSVLYRHWTELLQTCVVWASVVLSPPLVARGERAAEGNSSKNSNFQLSSIGDVFSILMIMKAKLRSAGKDCSAKVCALHALCRQVVVVAAVLANEWVRRTSSYFTKGADLRLPDGDSSSVVAALLNDVEVVYKTVQSSDAVHVVAVNLRSTSDSEATHPSHQTHSGRGTAACLVTTKNNEVAVVPVWEILMVKFLTAAGSSRGLHQHRIKVTLKAFPLLAEVLCLQKGKSHQCVANALISSIAVMRVDHCMSALNEQLSAEVVSSAAVALRNLINVLSASFYDFRERRVVFDLTALVSAAHEIVVEDALLKDGVASPKSAASIAVKSTMSALITIEAFLRGRIHTRRRSPRYVENWLRVCLLLAVDGNKLLTVYSQSARCEGSITHVSGKTEAEREEEESFPVPSVNDIVSELLFAHPEVTSRARTRTMCAVSSLFFSALHQVVPASAFDMLATIASQHGKEAATSVLDSVAAVVGIVDRQCRTYCGLDPLLMLRVLRTRVGTLIDIADNTMDPRGSMHSEHTSSADHLDVDNDVVVPRLADVSYAAVRYFSALCIAVTLNAAALPPIAGRLQVGMSFIAAVIDLTPRNTSSLRNRSTVHADVSAGGDDDAPTSTQSSEPCGGPWQQEIFEALATGVRYFTLGVRSIVTAVLGELQPSNTEGIGMDDSNSIGVLRVVVAHCWNAMAAADGQFPILTDTLNYVAILLGTAECVMYHLLKTTAGSGPSQRVRQTRRLRSWLPAVAVEFFLTGRYDTKAQSVRPTSQRGAQLPSCSARVQLLQSLLEYSVRHNLSIILLPVNATRTLLKGCEMSAGLQKEPNSEGKATDISTTRVTVAALLRLAYRMNQPHTVQRALRQRHKLWTVIHTVVMRDDVISTGSTATRVAVGSAVYGAVWACKRLFFAGQPTERSLELLSSLQPSHRRNGGSIDGSWYSASWYDELLDGTLHAMLSRVEVADLCRSTLTELLYGDATNNSVQLQRVQRLLNANVDRDTPSDGSFIQQLAVLSDPCLPQAVLLAETQEEAVRHQVIRGTTSPLGIARLSLACARETAREISADIANGLYVLGKMEDCVGNIRVAAQFVHTVLCAVARVPPPSDVHGPDRSVWVIVLSALHDLCKELHFVGAELLALVTIANDVTATTAAPCDCGVASYDEFITSYGGDASAVSMAPPMVSSPVTNVVFDAKAALSHPSGSYGAGALMLARRCSNMHGVACLLVAPMHTRIDGSVASLLEIEMEAKHAFWASALYGGNVMAAGITDVVASLSYCWPYLDPTKEVEPEEGTTLEGKKEEEGTTLRYRIARQYVVPDHEVGRAALELLLSDPIPKQLLRRSVYRCWYPYGPVGRNSVVANTSTEIDGPPGDCEPEDAALGIELGFDDVDQDATDDLSHAPDVVSMSDISADFFIRDIACRTELTGTGSTTPAEGGYLQLPDGRIVL